MGKLFPCLIFPMMYICEYKTESELHASIYSIICLLAVTFSIFSFLSLFSILGKTNPSSSKSNIVKKINPTSKHDKTSTSSSSKGNKIVVKPKEQEILVALGKLHAGGITPAKREMVQALAKQGKTPESYKKNLGILKKKGLLEYCEANAIALTKVGIDYIGGIVSDSESMTNNIYHEEIIQELISKKAYKIFKHIVDGNKYNKLEVAEQLGYDLDKLSGYEKDLSKMSTLGFLEKTSTTIQLTDKCYPLGRP